jgi:hypothetical protein
MLANSEPWTPAQNFSREAVIMHVCSLRPARRCAALIASYARYVLITATISGTTGDHPQQAHRKDHLSSGSHDRCSDRCRCLKEKPAIRYIDHCTLEGERSKASNRA